MKSTPRKRGVAALVTAGAVVAGSLVAASPAQAFGCAPGSDLEGVKVNRKTIALPGKPDIQLAVSLCLYNHTGSYQGLENFEWASTTGGDGEGGHDVYSCSWRTANTSGMSTDGKVVYDVADDGQGEKTWQLTGA